MSIFCGNSQPGSFDFVRLSIIRRILEMNEKPEPRDLGVYKRMLDDLLIASDVRGGSDTEILDLHKNLDAAISSLSGIQQNGGQGTTWDKEFDAEMKNEIRSSLRKIEEGLTA